MGKTSINILMKSLKEMIAHCQNIHELLKIDVDHFSKNAITSIEHSNQQKEVLVNQLHQIANELQPDASSQSLIDRLENEKQNLDTTTQKELQAIVNELKKEISGCYHFIETNSNIVMGSMNHLKNIWDNLISLNAEATCVYDSTGCKV